MRGRTGTTNDTTPAGNTAASGRVRAAVLIVNRLLAMIVTCMIFDSTVFAVFKRSRSSGLIWTDWPLTTSLLLRGEFLT